MITTMAAISGEQLVTLVIWLLIAGTIFWLLSWLIDYVNPAEPFKKIARVVIAIIAVILCINALLGLIGKSFIAW